MGLLIHSWTILIQSNRRQWHTASHQSGGKSDSGRQTNMRVSHQWFCYAARILWAILCPKRPKQFSCEARVKLWFCVITNWFYEQMSFWDGCVPAQLIHFTGIYRGARILVLQDWGPAAPQQASSHLGCHKLWLPLVVATFWGTWSMTMG